MNQTTIDPLTDEELVRHFQFSDHPEVKVLVLRLEQQLDDSEANEQEQSFINWATGCFSEHAGEDHHSNVIDRLRDALRLNKPETKPGIEGVIESLEEMDLAACYELDAMKDGIY